MNPRAALIVLIIVVIVVYISQQTSPEIINPQLVEVDRRVRHVLSRKGHSTQYSMQDHPDMSFTLNKNQVNVCTSCLVPDDITVMEEHKHNIVPLDKLVYIGLHEVSHVINKGQDHDEAWKAIFHDLLREAASLGYLDEQRLSLT